jgi:hypothetical protein
VGAARAYVTSCSCTSSTLRIQLYSLSQAQLLLLPITGAVSFSACGSLFLSAVFFFYLFFAALSYRFMYDERLTAHPKVMICMADSLFNLLVFLINMPQFLKDQVKRELSVALNSIPTMQEHPSVP